MSRRDISWVASIIMNALNVPSERFVQIDSIINLGNIAPCVPTERYEHHESFFYPRCLPTAGGCPATLQTSFE